MASSPNRESSDPISVSIASGGIAQPQINIVNIAIVRSINRIPHARLVIEDGAIVDGNYPLSESDLFKPGAEISIRAGYGAKQHRLFEGVVVRHGLRFTAGNGSQLHIECRDAFYAMTLDRKNATYVNKKDSAVIQEIVSGYSRLKANVSATGVKHGEQVQFNCSDWDYVLMRAEVNGMVVIVDDGKIDASPPNVAGTPVLTLSVGEDVISFDADIDGRTQLQSVEAAAWDLDKLKMDVATAKPKQLNKQGDWSGSELASTVGTENYRMQTSAALDQETLDQWAKSRQLKAGLARIQGSVSFQGSEKAKVGSLINIRGVGKRFEGELYVSRVEHEIADGEWVTHVEFGLAPEWLGEAEGVSSAPAAGLLPAVAGLQVGIVRKLDGDPDEQYRIQVHVSALGDGAEPVWARLSNFSASRGFGSFFVPEIDDEVLLGFLDDNPSQPVVLGSLYSSRRSPAEPYKLEDDNNLKALVTRSNLKVQFDDHKKTITVETAAGNMVMLDDDERSITLSDQHENTVVMNADGISLDSPKDITIAAKGSVSISAGSNIDVSARSDVNVDGANINQSATVQFTAKGNASAELSASGNTTVKGAMVLIN